MILILDCQSMNILISCYFLIQILIITASRSITTTFKFATTYRDGFEYASYFRYANILGFNLNNKTKKIIIIILLNRSPIIISSTLELIDFVAIFSYNS